MDILQQLGIGIVLIGAVSTTHYYILNSLAKVVNTDLMPQYLRLIIVIYGITFSQVVTAVLFALGFEASIFLGLGNLTSGTALSFIDVCYFSLINLTTLGLGQIDISGHLSFLAGLEAMTGFLLVSCSASLILKTMNHEK